MTRRFLLAAALTCLAPFLPAQPQRWEKTIQAFERQDRLQPPTKRGIVFIGSSSIRLWDLEKHFPGLPVVNRGFGGSHIADCTYYAPRILLPLEPRIVVLYAGDNDIAAGKSPEQVFADFQEFVSTVHRALPATRIVFIAIKPSLARWKLVEKMRRANAWIRKAAGEDPLIDFVDVDAPMIGPDGKPRPELFREDGLHLNEKGYALWTRLLKPYLER